MTDKITINRATLQQALDALQDLEGYRPDIDAAIIALLAALAAPQPAQEPLFWYRPCSNGMYEGPIHNAQIERVRKESGAWAPLYAAPQHQPAQEPANLCPYTEDEDGKRDAWIEGWESAQAAALAAPQPASLNKMLSEQKDLPPEIAKVLADNLWELYATDTPQPVQEPVGYISKTGHGTYFRETLTDELKSLEWADEKMWKAVFYAAPQPQRQTLTDEFVRLVVRSKQPHLSTESKAWKDLFASCKYWLEAAHGITGGTSA